MLIGQAIILSIIYSRWLHVDGVGILALLLLLQTFSFRFGNLGFGSAFAYFLAREELSLSGTMRVLRATAGVISLLCVIVILIIWRCDFSPWNDIRPSLFYLALPLVPLIFFKLYMLRILSGQLRISAMNMVELMAGYGRLFLVCFFVILLRMGIDGAVLSILFSDILAVGIMFFLTRITTSNHQGNNNQPAHVKDLIFHFWRYGRWNYLLMFSNFLCEELPLIFLKNISLANSQVGFFARARGIGNYTRLITQPVSQMLFPFTAASSETIATRRTNVLCRNSTLIAVFTIGLMTILAKTIIVLLYGEEFLPAVRVFYALAPGFIFWPLGHFIGIHIAASGRPKNVFIRSLITVILAVPISYFLISRYGMIGAGLSVTCVNVIQILLRLQLYSRLTRTNYRQVLFIHSSDIIYYKYAFQSLKAIGTRLIKKK